MKYVWVVFTALLIVCGSVSADQSWAEVEDGLIVVDPLGMTADELADVLINAQDGTHIGEPVDILTNVSSDEIAISMDVGEFLGVGKKPVLIPAMKLSAHADGVTLEMTREELEALPEYQG